METAVSAVAWIPVSTRWGRGAGNPGNPGAIWDKPDLRGP